MRRQFYTTIAGMASGAIHTIIAIEIKLVDRFVPQRVIDFIVSKLDWLLPRFARILNRHVIIRARETDARYLKGTVSKTVQGAETYLSYKIAPAVIHGVEQHLPEAASSRKISSIVAGVGKYIPDSVIPTEYIEQWLHLKERFGLTASMIDRLTGVRERRYAADGDASSDLSLIHI